MTEEITEHKEKMQKGAWDNMSKQGYMKKEIRFELNKEEKIVFPQDFIRPIELPNKDSKGEVTDYYYRFDVLQDGEEKLFFSAAWTLLTSLKTFEPLAGKRLIITKKAAKGKQYFEVKEIKQ